VDPDSAKQNYGGEKKILTKRKGAEWEVEEEAGTDAFLKKKKTGEQADWGQGEQKIRLKTAGGKKG